MQPKNPLRIPETALKLVRPNPLVPWDQQPPKAKGIGRPLLPHAKAAPRQHLLSCRVQGAARGGGGRRRRPRPPPPASTSPPPFHAGPKERGEAPYPAPGAAATSRLSRNYIF